MPDDVKIAPDADYRPQVPGFLIPDSFDAIERIAKKFCDAGWVPKSYLDKSNGWKPNQAAVEVGIIAGMSLGIMNPLACLTSIAVVNGTPTLWGDGMMAVVIDSGLLEDIEETFEKGDGDEGMVATCTVKRRGGRTVTQRFTWAMAKKAGLTGKDGSWQTYPARMMAMRARSWALRDAFADVLKGMHSAEEMIDAGDLVMQADGSYAAPPRPTREEFDAEIPKRPRAEIIAEQEQKDELTELIEEGKGEPFILRAVDHRDDDQPWEYDPDKADLFVSDVYADLMEAASRGRDDYSRQWDRHSPQFSRLPPDLRDKARAIAEEAGPIADMASKKAAPADEDAKSEPEKDGKPAKGGLF